MLCVDGRQGKIVQLVVVAIITEGGGALRMCLQIGFVLLVKERVLAGQAIGDRVGRQRPRAQRPGQKSHQDVLVSHYEILQILSERIPPWYSYIRVMRLGLPASRERLQRISRGSDRLLGPH